MKKVLGVYQSGEGEFVDKNTGQLITYDSIMIWYVTDEIPANISDRVNGSIAYCEKLKRKEVRLLNSPSGDWFDLVGAEVEFLYSKDKDGNPKISGVFVQEIP